MTAPTPEQDELTISIASLRDLSEREQCERSANILRAFATVLELLEGAQQAYRELQRPVEPKNVADDLLIIRSMAAMPPFDEAD